jgi:hypothetical protein
MTPQSSPAGPKGSRPTADGELPIRRRGLPGIKQRFQIQASGRLRVGQVEVEYQIAQPDSVGDYHSAWANSPSARRSMAR